jgi:hypothetical protein
MKHPCSKWRDISSASARLLQKNGAVDRSYREDEREEVRKGEKVERGKKMRLPRRRRRGAQSQMEESVGTAL